MKNLNFPLIVILFLLAIQLPAQVQPGAPYVPSTLVKQVADQNIPFEDTDFFDVKSQRSQFSDHPNLQNALTKGTVVSLNPDFLESFQEGQREAISVDIPTTEGNFRLKLVQVDVVTPGRKVGTSSMGSFEANLGKHFRGIIEGYPNSVAALSVISGEVMGFFASSRLPGNYVIGRIQNSKTKDHIIYNDTDLKDPSRMFCDTESDGIPYKPEDLLPPASNRDAGDCVGVFVEVDDNVYTALDSDVDSVIEFIVGLFNQSITIFAAESINMRIDSIFIWTTDAGYSGGAGSIRSQWWADNNNQSDIPADIGHYIYRQFSGGGGIAAGFNALCAADVDDRICVSTISLEYEDVPTYSRQVKVVTHEMGHLLGSRHTHGCVWGGNGDDIEDPGETTIDDYGNVSPNNPGSVISGSEGEDCFMSPGKTDPNVHIPTIMSYYDSRGWGTFSMGNGFGVEPGNVMRNDVAAAGCLDPCCPAADAICQNITKTLNALTGSVDILPSDIDNGSTTDCGFRSWEISKSNFTCADIGPNAVTLSVTDDNYITSTCNATVTIEENLPPTTICQDVTINNDPGDCDASVTIDMVGGSGMVELIDSFSFDDCSQPSGWFIDDGTGDPNNGYSGQTAAGLGLGQQVFYNKTEVLQFPSAPNPNFAGCIALVDDDAAGFMALGIGCIVIPVSIPPGYTQPTFSMDWEHEAVGGDGDMFCDYWNGSAWVNVVTADNDSWGTIDQQPLTENDDMAIRFCYDDEGAFAWGAGFDNLSIRAEAPGPIINDYNNTTDASDTYPVGTTPVTYSSVCGTDICSFNVTVFDNEAPTAVCQDMTITLDGAGMATIDPADADGGSFDNCDIDSVRLSQTAFTCVDLYRTDSIIMTAVDIYGNEDTCEVNIVVTGTDADNDGYFAECEDCNDADPLINPGVDEMCGDGIDNNCDNMIDDVTSNGYCCATGTNPNAFIDQVALSYPLGNIVRMETSGTDTMTMGYGNYTDPKANITADYVPFVYFSIKPGLNRLSYMRIWVDWDQNGDFDPYEMMAQQIGNSTWNGQISVPNMLRDVPDEYVMRVGLSQRGYIDDPCDEAQRGEYEDYILCLGVGCGVPPSPPLPLVGNDIPLNQGDLISIDVRPNPFRDNIVLAAAIETAGAYEVRLIDQQGKVVLLQQFDAAQGFNQLELTTQHLASGMYYVQVIGGGVYEVLKVVKE